MKSDDPVQQLKEKMIHETFVEVQSGFMLGVMAGFKAIGIDFAKVRVLNFLTKYYSEL